MYLKLCFANFGKAAAIKGIKECSSGEIKRAQIRQNVDQIIKGAAEYLVSQSKGNYFCVRDFRSSRNLGIESCGGRYRYRIPDAF